MKHRVLLLAIVCASAASVGACLGRTGIGADDIAAAGGESPGEDATPDGAIGDSAVPNDTSIVDAPDTSTTDTSVVDTALPDTAPPPSDGIDFFDLFPIPDSGPLGTCATCVADNCRDQVNACLNDPTCRTGLICTVTTCLGGGGTPDLTCALGCFGGDFSTATEAISAFTCVVSKCGSDCGGIFGGLGGGDAGGAPPPSDAGSGGARVVPPSLDHAWTPEEVMSLDPSTPIRFSPTAFDAWRDQLYGPGCGPR